MTGSSGCGGESLGERELAGDVQPPDAAATHGEEALVETGDDVGGGGISRDADVVGLALLEELSKICPFSFFAM